MKCPDIDRLIDSLAAGKSDPEVQAHLEVCPSCRADAQLLTDLAQAESLDQFENTVTTLYELPLSEKDVGDKSLETKFLKWLSKQ